MDEEFLRSLLASVNVDTTSLLGSFLEEAQCLVSQSSEVNGNLMRQLNLINTLLDLITPSDANNERKEILETRLKLVVDTVCMPALRLVGPGEAPRGKLAQMLHTVCRILSRACFLLLETTEQLYQLCVASLESYSEEMHLLGHGKDPGRVSSTLNVHCALEITHYMLDSPSANVFHRDEVIFKSIVAMLLHGDYSTCSKAAGITLPKFFVSPTTGFSAGQRLKLLWDHISLPQLGYLRNQLLVLFMVFDLYFAHAEESALPDIRTEERFWEILQAGIIESDSLSRKFAINLLKKVINITQRASLDLGAWQNSKDQLKFWWSKSEKEKLISVWQDYIYLVDALEETQMHMVMDLSPRLDSLILATMHTNDGHPYLHTSWILLILQNAFTHSNRYTVSKWALVKFLTLDFSHFPLLKQGEQQFIYGLVLETLNESSQYSRQPGSPVGSCPLLGNALVRFFTSLLTGIDKDIAVSFLQDFLVALQKARGWNPLSLFFVFYGLSLAPSFGAWNSGSLLLIREMVSTWTVTFKPIFRGAIQCSVLESLLKFVDCSSVSLYQLSLALTAFNSGESLTRNSVLWNKLCIWLKKNSFQIITGDDRLVDVLYQDISEFFADLQKKEDTNEMVDDRSVQRLAKIMLLVTDSLHFDNKCAQQEFCKESSPGESPLDTMLLPLANTLRMLRTNLYLSPVRAHASLQLLLELLNEVNLGINGPDINSDKTIVSITKLIDSYMREIWSYIEQKLTGHLTKVTDVPRLNLYIDLLSQLTEFLHKTVSKEAKFGSSARRLMKNKVLELAEACAIFYRAKQGNSSENESISKLCVVRCLSWISQYAVIDTSVDGSSLRKVVEQAEISFCFQRPKEIVAQRDWGKLASLFYTSRWNIVHCLQSIEGGQSNNTDQNQKLLIQCVESMPLVSIKAANEIFKCIKVLLPEVLEQNTELCLQAIEIGYQTMCDLDRGTLEFWDMLGLYVDLTYQKYLLLKEPGTSTHDKLQQTFQKLYSFGERKAGIVNAVVSQCLRVWSDTMADVAKRMLSATYHLNIIVEACVYGQSNPKNLRTQIDVGAFIYQLGGQFSTNQMLDSVFREGSEVRIGAVQFVCNLVTDNCMEVQNFLHRLAKELLKRDKGIDNKKTYFKDSQIHKVRQRIWQILLILHSTFTKDLSESVLDWAMESLVAVNQMSVRLMHEWMTILLLHKFPGLHHHFWTLLEQGPDKRIGCISSLLSIIPHLGSLCDRIQMEAFFSRSIPQVALWLMAQNFSVKLYAQAALTKIWQICTAHQLHGLMQTHSIIGDCLEFSKHSKHAFRLGDKLTHDFFFFHFHPLKDLSIETLFNTLPQLCDVYEEELIDPAKFDVPNVCWNALPLYNPRDDLKRCLPGSWKLRILDADKANGHSQLAPLDFGDVQRKITPCNSSEVLEENVASSQQSSSTKKGSLILVASLIEKSPNLGGLCRTSEIFGVSTLVLNSLQCIDSKEFQSLSVTAEKWVNLQEVKVEQLKDYLLGMRKDGYLLVGIEQTANSQNLTNYSFTEKTVLLLGNEKKGIPAGLIPLLDSCVEIPQLGLVRSLNVHVSGAICVWEYTRQNLLT